MEKYSDFSPYAKFAIKYNGFSFYINNVKIAKCVAFRNYYNEFMRVLSDTPEIEIKYDILYGGIDVKIVKKTYKIGFYSITNTKIERI